jgi:hypothetical protein
MTAFADAPDNPECWGTVTSQRAPSGGVVPIVLSSYSLGDFTTCAPMSSSFTLCLTTSSSSSPGRDRPTAPAFSYINNDSNTLSFLQEC